MSKNPYGARGNPSDYKSYKAIEQRHERFQTDRSLAKGLSHEYFRNDAFKRLAALISASGGKCAWAIATKKWLEEHPGLTLSHRQLAALDKLEALANRLRVNCKPWPEQRGKAWGTQERAPKGAPEWMRDPSKLPKKPPGK